MNKKQIRHTVLTRQIASMIQTIGNKLELRAVSNVVREQFDKVTVDHCRAFHVGDKVTFDTKYGQQSGVVVRVNLRTLSIDCADGPFRQWRVSPEHVDWTEMIVSQKKPA